MNLQTIDKGVYKIWKKVAKLEFINPINQKEEKAKFFSSATYNPRFRYEPLDFNASRLKEKLKKYKGALRGEKDTYARLLKGKIDKLILWIELLEAVGSAHFTRYSLEYYGKPSSSLIKKAKKEIWIKGTIEEKGSIPAEQVACGLAKKAKELKLDWKVKVKENLGARADNVAAEHTLYIKKGELFSKQDIKRLAVHELGVHATRAFNGWKHPYKLFFIGTAGYEFTEEGLAAYMEQVKGVQSKNTLKSYAGRVIAVDLALKKSFQEVYRVLMQYMPSHEAYQLTMRAKRGLSNTSKPGGFTKDYIYLYGLERVKKVKDLTPLFKGRIDIKDVPFLKKIKN